MLHGTIFFNFSWWVIVLAHILVKWHRSPPIWMQFSYDSVQWILIYCMRLDITKRKNRRTDWFRLEPCTFIFSWIRWWTRRQVCCWKHIWYILWWWSIYIFIISHNCICIGYLRCSLLLNIHVSSVSNKWSTIQWWYGVLRKWFDVGNRRWRYKHWWSIICIT